MNTREERSNQILKPMAAAVFLIFFNGYMVAPLIPSLATEFGVGIQAMGWVVPAYMLTYGCSTLVYGPLSDRIGRKQVILTLVFAYIFITFCVSLASTYRALIFLRVASGLCAGGILPIALALITDLYPYDKIGRPMGWMFGAVAGGTAFGSTLGAWLNPFMGWRNEFVCLAAANALVFVVLMRRRHAFDSIETTQRPLKEILLGYKSLLTKGRGFAVYSIIFLNGTFHSGIFSWLGFYLLRRYGLTDAGIGQALLGYGLPGMFLAPTIGKLADRYGRKRIIPIGFLVAAFCAFALVPTQPVLSAVLVITALSIGFDMTHPLMTAVVGTLDPNRRGQAMGLNAFAIFMGFGSGALIFQMLLNQSFTFALLCFASVQLLLVFVSARVFRNEIPKPAH